MKKFLIFASAALFALVACNKEQEKVNPVIQDEEIVLTFTSQRPELNSDTRTAWDATSRSIIWSASDKIRVGYKLNNDWMGKSAAGNPKFYASEAVSIDSNDPNIGSFRVPISDNTFTDPETNGSYVFYGIFPSSVAGSAAVSASDAVSTNGVATLTLPDTQTPAEASFDPSADIMIGKTESITGGGLPTDPISISWNRIVAHVDITFSSFNFDGSETVSEITITSSGKLAGSFTADLESGSLVTETADNTVIINGDNLSVNGSSVEAWVSVLPGAFTSLVVEVKTDKATYTRSITGLSNKAFKQNARNTLTINMANAERVENLPTAYELYSGDVTEGVYIIYDATDGHALKAVVASNRFGYEEITPDADGAIRTNDESILWYISPSGEYVTIFNNAIQKYAAATGSNNQGQLIDSGSDNKSLWTVSGEYDFINKSNSRYLRSNGTYGFACYTADTGHTLKLYKFDSREPLDAPATVTASLNSTTPNAINVTFSTVSDAESYVITATPTGEGVTVTKSVTASPATIDGLAYNTEYSISVYAVPDPEDGDHKRSAATEAAESVTTGPKPAAPEGYEIVSTTTAVSSGLYIIAAKVGDKYYAMPNAFTAQKPSGVEVSVLNDVISTSDAADYSVTLTKDSNTNYYTIQGSGKKLLGWSSSTNFNYTGTNTDWTLTTGVNGTFRLTNVGSAGTSTTRVIAFTGSAFGPYAASNVTSGSTSYYDVELFKFNGVVKTDPTITVTPASPISLEVGNTQQLTVTTDSDGAVTYESSNTDVATVSNSGLITAVAAGSATISVKTAATNSYNAGSTPVTVNVVPGASTISQITAAGTYKVVNAVVMAAKSGVKNFIVSDGTGNIVVYHSSASHGFVVGDVVTVNGTVKTYAGVWEFDEPTVTKTGTATPSYPAPVEYDATKITNYATTPVIEYGHARGVVDGNNVTVAEGKVLNVYGDLSSFNGKTVDVSGYSFGYNTNSGKISFMQVGAAAEYVDPNAPALSIDPSTSSTDPASWSADNDDAKTFTVTPTNGTWAITDDSTVTEWATISTNGDEITVTPKAKQATEVHEGSIVITLTPSNQGYESVTATIYLKQAKYSGGTTDWSTTYTSNVTLPQNATNVSSCKVIISGTEYTGTKLGKSGSGASANITIPAGTTKLYVHSACWKDKSASLALTTTASGVTISPSTDWSLTSDNGISSNSPFTLNAPNKASTDYFKEYTLTGVNSSITIKIEAKSERAVFWGINAE